MLWRFKSFSWWEKPETLSKSPNSVSLVYLGSSPLGSRSQWAPHGHRMSISIMGILHLCEGQPFGIPPLLLPSCHVLSFVAWEKSKSIRPILGNLKPFGYFNLVESMQWLHQCVWNPPLVLHNMPYGLASTTY